MSLQSIPEPLIIYEDEILLVVNKPAGLMVEPDRNNHPNLLDQLKQYLRNKSGAKNVYLQHLHRLDRPVSGIVLFTKQKEHLRNLSEQFAQRMVEKRYIAITENCPNIPSGKLEHWHRKEKKKALLFDREEAYTEKALLEYTTVPCGSFCKWNIHLHTGKFHQIRAQLSNSKCPIIGDVLYGSVRSYLLNAIALHAAQLSLIHPTTGMKLDFNCEPPDEMRSLMNA